MVLHRLVIQKRFVRVGWTSHTTRCRQRCGAILFELDKQKDFFCISPPSYAHEKKNEQKNL